MNDTNTEENTSISMHLQMAMEVGNVAWWEMELPSGKVTFNENKTKMIGYDAKDFKHYEDFTKLVHPDDYKKIMKDMMDHIEGKKDIYETEYRIRSKSGEYKWFYDRGRIIKKDGNGYMLIIGVVQDITKLKSTINSFENKAKELEEMNKFMVDRELKMTELKKEIEELKNQIK